MVKTTASIHWLLTHLYQAMTAALTQIDKYCFHLHTAQSSNWGKREGWGGTVCSNGFCWTFQTNTKCNNKNHVWSHFYNILVVLKYHRRLLANIFDTDISRCINTYIKVVYLAFLGYFCSYKCFYSDFEKNIGYKICLIMLQNEL